MLDLKWSQFIFWVEPIDEKDRIIIRSTLTKGTVKMKKEVKEAINAFLNENNSEFSEKFKDYINCLIQLGLLVPQDLNETERYLSLFHHTRNNNSILGIYLVTTTSCQLRCPYCYEQGINQKKFLDFQTANKIVSWCQRYLEKNKQCNKFRVILYGGEPLLNKRIIEYVLPKLYQTATRSNCSFETQIITNGVLLNRRVTLFLANYHLNRIQITLDGPQRVHDQRRIRKNGKGTFNQIFQNILDILNSNVIKKISLRINFDQGNIDSIPELLDVLAIHKLQPKLELSFGIITPTICNESRKKTKVHIEKYGFGDAGNIEKYLWLWSEAKKQGFTVLDEFMLGPWCSARATHSAVIEPDGSLIKCFSGVGREEFMFGNIDSKFDCNDSRFSDFTYIKECLEKRCPHVPICGGGCRFESFIRLGNFRESYCQFKLIDQINKGLLRLKYS